MQVKAIYGPTDFDCTTRALLHSLETRSANNKTDAMPTACPADPHTMYIAKILITLSDANRSKTNFKQMSFCIYSFILLCWIQLRYQQTRVHNPVLIRHANLAFARPPPLAELHRGF